MPGISPFNAISLKHILHNPNFLIYPSALPQLKHLLYALDENLGVFLDLTIKDFRAKAKPPLTLHLNLIFALKEGLKNIKANKLHHPK